MHTPKHLPYLATLLLTACHTTPPKRFELADLNHDGNLSQAEVSDHMVTLIFDSRDANHDKMLTLDEWNPTPTASETTAFRARDTFKDGKVTIEEAKAYAKKMGSYSATFKEADTNKDGFVNQEEARAFYASKEGPVR